MATDQFKKLSPGLYRARNVVLNGYEYRALFIATESGARLSLLERVVRPRGKNGYWKRISGDSKRHAPAMAEITASFVLWLDAKRAAEPSS